MKKIITSVALAGTLATAGCSTQPLSGNDAATVGGLAIVGAVAGGLIGDDLKGALLGAAVGSAAGAVLVARDRAGTCYYQRPNGSFVKARCA